MIKIRLPYSLYERSGYEQEIFEDTFSLNEENELLKYDGKRSLQDDLNLYKDTNSIYEIIDKFQNTNKLMSDAAEAFEFMKRIGKTPADMSDLSIHDVAILPKSLQELIQSGNKLSEVLNEVNNQNANFNFEQNKVYVEKAQNQSSGSQNTKTTEEKKEVVNEQ